MACGGKAFWEKGTEHAKAQKPSVTAVCPAKPGAELSGDGDRHDDLSSPWMLENFLLLGGVFGRQLFVNYICNYYIKEN